MVLALKTLLARNMDARALTEGVILGDWSFRLGTGGVNPLDPFDVADVDPSLQELLDPVGEAQRRPGTILVTDTAATVDSVDPVTGIAIVSGLTGIPTSSEYRNFWLLLSGAPDDGTNGLWKVGANVDDTTLSVFAPLAAAQSGLTWTLYENSLLQPSDDSYDFYCRVERDDVSDPQLYSEVGVSCRVLVSPADESIVGDPVLYAVGHSSPKAKIAEAAFAQHVIVQE